MNILEILKGLGVEDSLAGQIESGIKSEIHKAFVPKEQYNKKIESLNSLEVKIKDLENSKQNIVEEKNKDNETINTILAKLNQLEEKEKKQIEQTRINKIKTELENKGLNPKISNLILKDIDLQSEYSEIINNISEN